VAPKSSSRARPLDLIFSGSGELGPGPAGSSRRTLKLPPLRVAKADVSTMLPYDRTGHCETESRTACIGVARDFNLVEWLKDLLALAPRNARSLVFHNDDDALGLGNQDYGSGPTILHSIVDWIRDGASQSGWTAGNRDVPGTRKWDWLTCVGSILADSPDECAQADQ
jgi:hypothetical protein